MFILELESSKIYVMQPRHGIIAQVLARLSNYTDDLPRHEDLIVRIGSSYTLLLLMKFAAWLYQNDTHEPYYYVAMTHHA